jgi:hypothetical protein
LLVAWVFILGMTVFDCYFAYQNRATISEWELNKLALWVIVRFGFGVIVAYKAVLFALLLVVIRQSQRLLNWTTAVLVVAHLVLLTMYLR